MVLENLVGGINTLWCSMPCPGALWGAVGLTVARECASTCS